MVWNRFVWKASQRMRDRIRVTRPQRSLGLARFSNDASADRQAAIRGALISDAAAVPAELRQRSLV